MVCYLGRRILPEASPRVSGIRCQVSAGAAGVFCGSGRGVLLDAFQAVRSASVSRSRFAFREPDVRGTHAAPAARDGKEDVRHVGDEFCLDFRREHQVAEALFHRRERGEDAAAVGTSWSDRADGD
jgi:hypothetical protein